MGIRHSVQQSQLDQIIDTFYDGADAAEGIVTQVQHLTGHAGHAQNFSNNMDSKTSLLLVGLMRLQDNIDER